MPDSVSLRAVIVTDAAAMVGVLADPALYQFTGGEPPSEDDLVRRYTAQAIGGSPDGSEIWLNLLVMVDKIPVGYVQATIFADDGVSEIAWVIGAPWQGRGYASRASGMLVADLATRGVRTVIAHIHPDHAASQGVARRLGMVPTDVVVDGEVRWTLHETGVRT